MKKYLIIASLLILPGCIYQNVTHIDLKAATIFCGRVENIYEISSHFVGEVYIRCLDGRGALAHKIEIPVEKQ